MKFDDNKMHDGVKIWTDAILHHTNEWYIWLDTP